MAQFTRLLSTTALLTLAALQPARADVSADDVWQAYKVYLESLGAAVTAQTSRSGDTMTVGEISMSWDLPMESGRLDVTLDGFDLTEAGDGTVAMSFADTLTYALQAEIKEKGTFSGKLNVASEGMAITASGSPDDITFEATADRLGIELADVGAEGMDTMPLQARGEIVELAGTSRIRTGSLVTASADYRIGKQEFSGTFTDPEGNESEFSGGADSTVAQSELVLPRSGTEIMNLAAAMEKGLKLSAVSKSTGYRNTQTVFAGGELVSSQVTGAATYDFEMALGGDGVQVAGQAGDMTGTFEFPAMMPLPIEIAAETTAMDMHLPVAAGEELQDAAMSFTLNGLTVSEQLWGLIDPGQQLPRVPMELGVDLDAKVKSFLDWFDFMDVAARFDRKETPGEIHQLTLNDFTLSAAGATLTATGQASFDNTDTTTFNGMPKPEGTLDVTLSGANALLDTLVGMGLVPEEQAVSARMMVGMVAKPDPAAGEDVLKSHLELTGDGQVLANGMRLK